MPHRENQHSVHWWSSISEPKLLRTSWIWKVLVRNNCYLNHSVSLAPKPPETLTLQDFADLPLLKLRGHITSVETASEIIFKHVTEVTDMETIILYLELGLGFCIMGQSYRINTSDNIRSIDLTRTNHLPSVGADAISLRGNQKAALAVLIKEMKQYIDDRTL